MNTRNRNNHIAMLTKSVDLMRKLFRDADAQAITTLRDGPDGWTALEVLCHLRDYDDVFQERVRRMIAEDNPMLEGFDHEQMVIDRAYNQQNVNEVLDTLTASRKVFKALFESLSDEQFDLPGIHPSFGPVAVNDVLSQTVWHDYNHVEQIIRILDQG